MISRILTSAILAVGLTSCFTGIENTPKISDKEVRKQLTQTITAEESFMNDLPQSNLSTQLYPGKRWVVTDSKIKLVLDASASGLDIAAGDTLRFVESVSSPTVAGSEVVDLIMENSIGKRIAYRTSIDPRRFSSGTTIDIPFAVDLDLINDIAAKLRGKQFYIVSRTRYDHTDNIYSSRRFVPVTIDSVAVGNVAYPIRISALEAGQKPFRLYMSSPFQSAHPRKFAKLFSLSDPRENYPAISSEVWQAIIEGKVMVGMTRDECRLAIGQPDNVDRQPGYSSLHEIWTYNNGRYLIFIDNILESFRN